MNSSEPTVDHSAPTPRASKPVRHDYAAILSLADSAPGTAVKVPNVSNVTVFSRTLHKAAQAGDEYNVYRVNGTCYVTKKLK